MVAGGQILEIVVLLFGRTFAVVAGNVGNDFQLRFGIAQQFAIADQVVGMLMVGRMADEMPTVVQNSGRPKATPAPGCPSYAACLGFAQTGPWQTLPRAQLGRCGLYTFLAVLRTLRCRTDF